MDCGEDPTPTDEGQTPTSDTTPITFTQTIDGVVVQVGDGAPSAPYDLAAGDLAHDGPTLTLTARARGELDHAPPGRPSTPPGSTLTATDGDTWHGFPIPWRELPPQVARELIRTGCLLEPQYRKAFRQNLGGG